MLETVRLQDRHNRGFITEYGVVFECSKNEALQMFTITMQKDDISVSYACGDTPGKGWLAMELNRALQMLLEDEYSKFIEVQLANAKKSE